jgi:hypothetical protein
MKCMWQDCDDEATVGIDEDIAFCEVHAAEYHPSEEYARQMDQDRREFEAAVEQIKAGFDTLRKLGKIDFLISIADWLDQNYRPPPRKRGGNNPKRLYRDQRYAVVFWKHYEAPEGGKQEVLRQHYEELRFKTPASLGRQFDRDRSQLSETDRTYGPVMSRLMTVEKV